MFRESLKTMVTKLQIGMLATIIVVASVISVYYFVLPIITPPPVAPQITLTMWGWGGDPLTTNEELRDAVISLWNKTHPNVKIEATRMSWGDVHDKSMISLIAGEGAPDIATVEHTQIAKYIATGHLVDVTEKIKPYLDDFPKWMIDLATGPDGKIYGIPIDTGECAVAYRIDIFEKYGLKTPDKWESWNDVITEGQKLRAQNSSIWMMKVARNDVNWPLMFLRAAGAQVMERREDGTVRCIVNNTKAVEVMEWLDSLVDVYDVAYYGDILTEDDWADLLNDRYIVLPVPAWLKISAPWSPLLNQTGKWRVCRWPSWEPGVPTSTNWGGSFYYITDQCENPDEAIELALWLATNATVWDMTWKIAGSAVFPAYAPIQQLHWYTDPDPFFGNTSFYEPIIEGRPYVPSMYFSEYFPVFWERFKVALSDIATENVPPAEALQRLADEVNREIAG